MIRRTAFALAITALSSPTLAHHTSPPTFWNDFDWRKTCEPETLRIETEQLSAEEWERIEKDADQIPNGEGRFWKATSPEGKVSHIWGTFHSPDLRVSDVPDVVKDTIKNAAILLVERSADATSFDFIRGSANGDGVIPMEPDDFRAITIDPYRDLSSDVTEVIEQRLSQMGFGPTVNLTALMPQFILNSLLWYHCDDRLIAAGFPIQDVRIEILARQAGVEIKSIEPPDIIDRMARDPAQTETLLALLTLYAAINDTRTPDKVGRLNATAMHLYLEGDISQLMALEEAMLEDSFPDIDARETIRTADDFLLVERNVVMANTALSALEAGGAVIAVGAFHLPGESGLIALLRQAGYAVERVGIPNSP